MDRVLVALIRAVDVAEVQHLVSALAPAAADCTHTMAAAQGAYARARMPLPTASPAITLALDVAAGSEGTLRRGDARSATAAVMAAQAVCSAGCAPTCAAHHIHAARRRVGEHGTLHVQWLDARCVAWDALNLLVEAVAAKLDALAVSAAERCKSEEVSFSLGRMEAMLADAQDAITRLQRENEELAAAVHQFSYLPPTHAGPRSPHAYTSGATPAASGSVHAVAPGGGGVNGAASVAVAVAATAAGDCLTATLSACQAWLHDLHGALFDAPLGDTAPRTHNDTALVLFSWHEVARFQGGASALVQSACEQRTCTLVERAGSHALYDSLDALSRARASAPFDARLPNAARAAASDTQLAPSDSNGGLYCEPNACVFIAPIWRDTHPATGERFGAASEQGTAQRSAGSSGSGGEGADVSAGDDNQPVAVLVSLSRALLTPLQQFILAHAAGLLAHTLSSALSHAAAAGTAAAALAEQESRAMHVASTAASATTTVAHLQRQLAHAHRLLQMHVGDGTDSVGSVDSLAAAGAARGGAPVSPQRLDTASLTTPVPSTWDAHAHAEPHAASTTVSAAHMVDEAAHRWRRMANGILRFGYPRLCAPLQPARSGGDADTSPHASPSRACTRRVHVPSARSAMEMQRYVECVRTLLRGSFPDARGISFELAPDLDVNGSAQASPRAGARAAQHGMQRGGEQNEFMQQRAVWAALTKLVPSVTGSSTSLPAAKSSARADAILQALGSSDGVGTSPSVRHAYGDAAAGSAAGRVYVPLLAAANEADALPAVLGAVVVDVSLPLSAATGSARAGDVLPVATTLLSDAVVTAVKSLMPLVHAGLSRVLHACALQDMADAAAQQAHAQDSIVSAMAAQARAAAQHADELRQEVEHLTLAATERAATAAAAQQASEQADAAVAAQQHAAAAATAALQQTSAMHSAIAGFMETWQLVSSDHAQAHARASTGSNGGVTPSQAQVAAVGVAHVSLHALQQLLDALRVVGAASSVGVYARVAPSPDVWVPIALSSDRAAAHGSDRSSVRGQDEGPVDTPGDTAAGALVQQLLHEAWHAGRSGGAQAQAQAQEQEQATRATSPHLSLANSTWHVFHKPALFMTDAPAADAMRSSVAPNEREAAAGSSTASSGGGTRCFSPAALTAMLLHASFVGNAGAAAALELCSRSDVVVGDDVDGFFIPGVGVVTGLALSVLGPDAHNFAPHALDAWRAVVASLRCWVYALVQHLQRAQITSAYMRAVAERLTMALQLAAHAPPSVPPAPPPLPFESTMSDGVRADAERGGFHAWGGARSDRDSVGSWTELASATSLPPAASTGTRLYATSSGDAPALAGSRFALLHGERSSADSERAATDALLQAWNA